jgi:hypothetical protein
MGLNMSQEIINNGESGLVVRSKINNMFTESYTTLSQKQDMLTSASSVSVSSIYSASIATSSGIDLDAIGKQMTQGGLWAPNEVPLLILLGQSNQDGRGIRTDVRDLNAYPWGTGTSAQVRMYVKQITRNPASSAVNHIDNGDWTDFDGTNTMVVSPQAANNGCGAELNISVLWAKSVFPLTNKPLHIIKVAIGGTPLASVAGGADTNWSPTSGQIWQMTIKDVIKPAIKKLLVAGKVPVCVGVHWGQGESDTDTAPKADAYFQNLTNFINRVRTETGFPTAKFLIMGLSNYSSSALWNTVKQAQRDVALSSPRTFLIPTDGSNGFAPCQRYMVGVQAGDIHLTAIGLSQHGVDIFNNLDIPGVKYQAPDAVCLVAADLKNNEAIPTTKIVSEVYGGAILAQAALTTDIGYIQSMSWFADPSQTARPGVGSVPSPRFRIPALDGSSDQEIIFQMAHNGETNTKPGVVLRGAHTTPVSAFDNTDFDKGLLIQVRNGGGQLTIFNRTSAWNALSGSPLTITPTPPVNSLNWYRIRLIGSTLTIDTTSASIPNEASWNNKYSLTDPQVTSATTFPTSGNTYFTLYNGQMLSAGPYSANCHFPVLIANAL